MTLRRLDSTVIGEMLAWKAGLGPEPAGLDRPRLVVQPANRPKVSAACGRSRLLRPGEPQVLGFEDRPLRVGERMVTTRDRPGLDVRRAPWRTFGPGVPVRVRVGGGGELGATVAIQTIRSYLDRYAMTAERGMADATGAPCRLGTTGALTVRPTIAHGVRRVGKEAHDVGEWLAEHRNPTAFGPVRTDPRGSGERAFRDACTLIRRGLDAGERVRVRDGRGGVIPEAALRRIVAARTASAELRREIVTAAAVLVGRPALDPVRAVTLAAGTCVEADCSGPAAGRSPRCPEHRAAAGRERSRRYRAAKGAAR